MGTLDEVLAGAAPAAVDPQTPVDSGAQGAATGETQQHGQTPPEGSGEAGAPAAAATDAPPASHTSDTVPVAALEAERKGRQDWKEKAIRFEEELKQLRAQQQQPQGNGAQQPAALTYEQALLNERMNMSEMMVRQQHQDVDEALETFQNAVRQNPALGAQLLRERHPWQWMYDQAKRMRAMEEIGTDPLAYEQKVREKILAEMKAGDGQPPPDGAIPAAPAAPTLPRSLATARSSAPRSAPAWTGPTSLNDILKR